MFSRILFPLLMMVSWFVSGCGSGAGVVTEIRVGLHDNNVLKIELNVTTSSPVTAYAEYWADSAGEGTLMRSPVAGQATEHRLVLCNILPSTDYSYRIVTGSGAGSHGKVFHFRSQDLPFWLKEQFQAHLDSLHELPAVFRDGFMLMNKRETPGVAYMVDYLGRLRWYHMVDGTGIKVTHFTKDKTILSILGRNDEPTSYGSEILELNMQGDTVLHLRKGQGDFRYTIHHEILRNDQGALVTLFVDQRVLDLRKIGGTATDTVNGDGILVMDSTGRKIWQWSTFDAVDPYKDPKILQTRRDWMHANSLNYDRDSNYIISFYNNGQIWKIDAQTGKVLWKFGKGGNIPIPAGSSFSESHAVHINRFGSLMFFDNGVENHLSEVYSFNLDEKDNSAKQAIHIRLPAEIYNDRMGSAYMINDTSVLCCTSKRKVTVLANLKGTLLWTLNTAIPPYRVEFLKQEDLAAYLRPE